MKKMRLLTVALLMALVLSACGKAPAVPAEEESREEKQDVELTLWTFPVGNWGHPTTVASLLAGFHKAHPNIHVSVEYLTYENGDERIEQALSEGTAPDLVLEGPERLVANWGERGIMADLSDLWESDAAGAVYDNIREACRQHGGSAYYAYPICMTAHCMAINYEMFEEADALQYIDEETHTWTTEGFIQAVHALEAHGRRAGTIYCKNQSGDQGTRALVTNLYGGSFTDDDHNGYTIDSPENRKALQLLYDLEGIVFEPSLSSADAIQQFCQKETAMTFCWNVSLEIQQTINNPNLDFEIFPMAFPTDGNELKLQGGIWGFGVFDNGDEEKMEAAKTFIRYMTEEDAPYIRAVQASGYWPVRDMENVYVNDMLMTEYSVFMPHMGDYYQITPRWTEARTAWWTMLQKIGAGTDIGAAMKGFPSSG